MTNTPMKEIILNALCAALAMLIALVGVWCALISLI